MTPAPPAAPSAADPKPDAPPRPMGRIFAAVILVEVVTLLALWWFQATFSRG